MSLLSRLLINQRQYIVSFQFRHRWVTLWCLWRCSSGTAQSRREEECSSSPLGTSQPAQYSCMKPACNRLSAVLQTDVLKTVINFHVFSIALIPLFLILTSLSPDNILMSQLSGFFSKHVQLLCSSHAWSRSPAPCSLWIYCSGCQGSAFRWQPRPEHILPSACHSPWQVGPSWGAAQPRAPCFISEAWLHAGVPTALWEVQGEGCLLLLLYRGILQAKPGSPFCTS